MHGNAVEASRDNRHNLADDPVRATNETIGARIAAVMSGEQR